MLNRLRDINAKLRESPAATAWTVSIALFTDMLVYGIIIPILPSILIEFGRDKRDLGILVASYAIGLFVFTPIFGILSDRYHSRKLPMLCGLAGLAVATVLFAFGSSFEQLILARFAQGISAGASWGIGLSMLADVYPSDRLGAVMGSVMGANVLGQLLGPPIGGFLYQHVGRRAPFYFCAGLAVVDFAVRLWVKPVPLVTSIGLADDTSDRGSDGVDDIEVEGGLDDGLGNRVFTFNPNDTTLPVEVSSIYPIDTGSTIAASDAGTHSVAWGAVSAGSGRVSVRGYINHNEIIEPIQPSVIATQSYTILHMLVDPPLVLDCLVTFAIANLFSGLEPTLPIYFRSAFDADETTIGLLFCAICVPNIFFSPLSGRLSDKFGPKLTSGVGTVLLAVVAPLIALPSGGSWLSIFAEVILLMVLGVMTAIAITPLMPDMADIVAKRGGQSYGQVYALFNMAYSLGMIAGPILATLFYDNLGFLMDLIVFSICLAAMGISLLVYEGALSWKSRISWRYEQLHPEFSVEDGLPSNEDDLNHHRSVSTRTVRRHNN